VAERRVSAHGGTALVNLHALAPRAPIVTAGFAAIAGLAALLAHGAMRQAAVR
jgi:hypothetical protein